MRSLSQREDISVSQRESRASEQAQLQRETTRSFGREERKIRRCTWRANYLNL